MDYYNSNQELKEVLDMIGSGFFSIDEPDRFKPIMDSLLKQGDHYLLLADYASYITCQKKVEDGLSQPAAMGKESNFECGEYGQVFE